LTPQDWNRIQAAFLDAVALAPEARATFLERQDPGDPDFIRVVKQLLQAHADAGGFLETPLVRLTDRTRRDTAADSGPPPRFSEGRYRLLSELGRGASSIVYLAERADAPCEPRVAVKVLRRSPDDQLGHRFHAERRLLAALDHEGIARLIDGDSTIDGQQFLVIEHVQGQPIDRFCDQRRLSVCERLRLFVKVCAAIQHAHERQIVHRDLKPAHILITTDGVPKLLDFGIAKILDPGRPGLTMARSEGRALTPHYASPEQVLGRTVSPASDVYALGAILYELVCGRRAHASDGDSLVAVLWSVCEQMPARPAEALVDPHASELQDGAPAAGPEAIAAARGTTVRDLTRQLDRRLDRILWRALEKDPAHRYPTVAALADDVRLYLAGRRLASRPILQGFSRLTARLRERVRRRPLLALAATGAVALAVLAGVVWNQRRAGATATSVARSLRLAEEIEQEARIDRLLPLHEASEMRQRIASAVDQARAELPRAPRPARAALHYLIGVGAHNLADPAEAERHLRMAWNLGLRTPEAAFALGRVHAALYKHTRGDRDRASMAPAPDLAGAPRRHRQEALRYLVAAGVGPTRSPEYLRALIALHDGRFLAAASEAESLAAANPILYEAWQLAGDALVAAGYAAETREHLAEARRFYQEAGERYAKALAVGRSDTALYLSECRRQVRLLALRPLDSPEDDGILSSALLPCELARRIQPDLLETELTQADILFRHAYWLLQSGRDPSPSADRALVLTERLLARAPENEPALITAGFAELAVGWRQLDMAESPNDRLRRAELHLDQARASHPRSALALLARSRVPYLRAKALVAAAQDPSPEYDRAIADCRGALSLDATESAALRCLTMMYSEKGDWLLEHGLEAQPALVAAIDWADRALAVNPQAENLRFALAVTQARLAAARHQAGEDPWDALRAAESNLRQSAIQRHPLAPGSLGVVARLTGWFRLDRDEDPTDDLERARNILEQEIRRIPHRGFLRRELASVALLEARWATKSGGQPRPLLEAARHVIAEAERVEPGAAEELALLRTELADLERLTAADPSR
jgi:serine/threonine protein kinase